MACDGQGVLAIIDRRFRGGIRKNSLHIALILSVFLEACALEKPYQPLDNVPQSFLSLYPVGTQTRSDADIQKVFEKNKDVYTALFLRATLASKATTGRTNIALALNPDGSVAAVTALDTSTTGPELTALVVETSRRLNFGPAPGEGFFVFWYPFRFH